MSPEDIRAIAENDQLKEAAFARYAQFILNERACVKAITALEDGPQRVRELPLITIDFICDMAVVTMRDFAERMERDAEESAPTNDRPAPGGSDE